MIKKALTYKDYAGKKVTNDFYFHIDESELIMMNWSERGGLSKYYEQIIKEEDNRKILAAFKELIDISYGVRSLDGAEFDKDPVHLKKFKSSGAYNQLLLELFTQNGDGENSFASEFAKGLLPDDLIERAQKIQDEEDKRKSADEPAVIEPSDTQTGTFEQPSFE